MEKLKKVWNYLSGKKTVIGAVLVALADIAIAIGQPEAAGVINQAAEILIYLGLAHKAVKVAKPPQ